MNPISQNPYRILGLKGNASAQEKQAAKNTIAAYLKVGSNAVLPFDNISNIETISRNQEMVDLASNAILDDNDKIIHSIFWFIAGNLKDELTLNNLIEKNDKEKAIEIFKLSTENSEIDSSNYASFINYSTLSMIGNSDMTHLKEFISIKRKLSTNREVINAIGTKLQLDVKNLRFSYITEEVLDKLIRLIKSLFPAKDEFELLNYFFSDDKTVLESGYKKLIQKLNQAVAETEEKRTKYFESLKYESVKLIRECNKIGEKLLRDAEPLLTDIKRFYGASHMQTQNSYERVFEEINYCIITPYNKFQSLLSDGIKNKNFGSIKTLALDAGIGIFDGAVSLTQKSISFSSDVTFPMRSTMQSNLTGIKEMRDLWKEKYHMFSSDNLGQSDEEGCGSQLGGCIGEGIAAIVVRIVIFGVVALLVRMCN
jgi:hypothetical protein